MRTGMHLISRILPGGAGGTGTRMAGALLLVAALAAPAFAQARVSHINGDPVEGKISSIENDTITLRDVSPAGAPTTLDVKEVEEIDYIEQRDPEPVGAEWTLRILMTTGDVFIGRVVKKASDGFIFESMSFGRFPIDIAEVKRIEVRRNLGAHGFQEDPDYMGSSDDALYQKPAEGADRGDVVGGTLEEVQPDGAYFLDKNNLFQDVMPWGSIQAIVRHVDDAPQPTKFQAIVLARNGERFTGELLKMVDRTCTLRSHVLRPQSVDTDAPENERKQHSEGLVLRIGEQHLMKLTLRHGKFAYLSDLKTTEVTEYPWFGGRSAAPRNLEDYWWHFRRDRAVDGSPLKLPTADGRTVMYTKGLGCHSYCKLSFPLGGNFERFLADIGVDTDANEQASVVFEVWADDETKPRYRSETVVRRSAALQSIEVDVRSVRTLHLIVNFGDNGDIQDRANWGKARVIKSQ